MRLTIFATATGLGLLTLGAPAMAAPNQDEVTHACTAGKAIPDDPEANFCRGELAFHDKRDADAYALYLTAAEKGNAPAQKMVGLMLEHGDGVARDMTTGQAWLLKAAEQGIAAAQCEYALHLYYGYDDVKAQPDAAIPWFRKAVDQGNANAQTMLAEAYYNGSGVEKRTDEAFRLYSLAAGQGHPYAMLVLAIMYIRGDGTKPDLRMAETWLVKSANQGLPDAQVQLGYVYAGPSELYDPVKALTWFDVYMANPNAKHQDYMATLLAKLSPEQQVQAKVDAASISLQLELRSH